jgi:hypothetical protein
MSSSIAEREPLRQNLPIAVWSFALALLFAEYVLAIFVFDAKRLFAG